MFARTALGALAWALVTASWGCDDQFDFDTQPLDAAAPDAEPIDAESDGASSSGRIACGASTCALPFRACCTRSGALVCIEPAEVDCTGLLIHCDSASDCREGAVCCARVGDAGVMSVRCEPPSECASPNQVVLCDPTDPRDCTNCEPAEAPLPSGYHRCR